jgi:hypothetical protein
MIFAIDLYQPNNSLKSSELTIVLWQRQLGPF